MRIDVHVHLVGADVSAKLDAIRAQLATVLAQQAREERHMGLIDDKLGDLNSAVARETDITVAVKAAMDGEVAIIADLRAQIANLPGVPQAALDAIDSAVSTMNANHDTLVAAVVEGTAAAPTP